MISIESADRDPFDTHMKKYKGMSLSSLNFDFQEVVCSITKDVHISDTALDHPIPVLLEPSVIIISFRRFPMLTSITV